MDFRWILCVFTFLNVMEVLIIANNSKNDLPVNEEIRVSELMVIGPNGEQMGVKNIKDALTLANYAGLDLVLLNPNSTPPVGKILDYNKYRYERQKKIKDAQKKARETNKDIKEYRLSVTIDVGDFETRKRNAEDYLKKGHKIKAFIRFKGRQMAHPELGKEVLLKFAEALSEVSSIEQEPKLDGRQIAMLLAPKK